jgi:hypothetical protein
VSGCKKYLEIGEPRTQLSGSSIFNRDMTAIAAQVAIYSQLEATGMFYNMTLATGMSSDEFQNHSFLIDFADLQNNNLTASNERTGLLWSEWYKFIYQANAMVEGLSRSAGVSSAVRDQLTGEALFVRALAYFNLVNLFGPIPLVTTTNYEVNARLPRSSIDSVYSQIKKDLESAGLLLEPEYRSANNSITSERVRPNKWAAKALLARILLYLELWQDAETLSTEVINSGPYSLNANLNNVFLKNNSEAIWQIMSVLKGYNSFAGGIFIETTTPAISSIPHTFLNSFRPDDNRRTSWIGSVFDGFDTYYFPYKYKIAQNAPTITEYTMVLRLAEQFLIRSEARAMQNNLLGSEEDLNEIRSRSGLQSISGLTQQMLLDSIRVERKFELAFETGDRWFNLKRINKANNILGPLKGANWQSTDQLYPIPLQEISLNSNLVQNPGY